MVAGKLIRRSIDFRVVLGLFAAANAWSWIRHSIGSLCCDQEMTIRFPVPFHISGGLAGDSRFYPIGLLLDLTLIATIALFAMWIAHLMAPHRPDRG